MMFRLLLGACLLISPALMLSQPAHAADKVAQQKLEKIKQERQRLAHLRQQLEGKLGTLAQEIRRYDHQLVAASVESRRADKAYRAVDARVRELQQQRQQLEAQAAILKEQLLDEAAAAWKHAGQFSAWQMLLSGVSMSEIPHRRYMLHQVMQTQHEKRMALQLNARQLAEVEQELAAQKEALRATAEEKRAAEHALEKQIASKRELIRRIESDVHLKQQQDRQLAREEQALLDLLRGIRKGLLKPEQHIAGHTPVRKMKGRLPWPLKGKIVASFGSRSTPNRPRLAGVELAPYGSREVRAIAAGQVRYADWFGGYGLMMIVDHGDGILSVYGHNNALYWQVGDWVDQGERLATAGNTGWSSKVRLYFELRDQGKAVNPRRWCRR